MREQLAPYRWLVGPGPTKVHLPTQTTTRCPTLEHPQMSPDLWILHLSLYNSNASINTEIEPFNANLKIIQ